MPITHATSRRAVLASVAALGATAVAAVRLSPQEGTGATMPNEGALFLGEATGQNAQQSRYATGVGGYAVQNLTATATNSNEYFTAFGPSVARQAEDIEGATLIGIAAAYFAKRVKFTIAVGYVAIRYATDLAYAVIMGYAAGEYAHRSTRLVAIGHHAGYRASDSAKSVMIGGMAGAFANDSPHSVMIGPEAGGVDKTDEQTSIPSAHHVTRGVYIGSGAGKASANTTDAVLIGTNTSAVDGLTNVVAIGKDAQATANNQFVIAPSLDVLFGVGGVPASLAAELAALKARLDAIGA
jgi:hypothetical protein